MTLQPWEHLREEPLVQYKVFDVHKARRRSPRTGKDIGFFLIRTRDWVNVVALTSGDELILVRQYRHGSRTMTLEIPGGLVDQGEEPSAAARRELREETGYTAGELIPLGSVNPNPALFTNRCHTFLALDCVRVGDPSQDPGEDLEVEIVPWSQAERMVATGVIDHALVLAAMYFRRLQTRSE